MNVLRLRVLVRYAVHRTARAVVAGLVAAGLAVSEVKVLFLHAAVIWPLNIGHSLAEALALDVPFDRVFAVHALGVVVEFLQFLALSGVVAWSVGQRRVQTPLPE